MSERPRRARENQGAAGGVVPIVMRFRLLFLVVAGLFGAAALPATELWAAEPEPFVPDLAPLRPAPAWTAGAALPAFSPARVHAEALRKDPLHKDRFVVEEVAGDAASPRVIFLIPQFHRNPLMPVAWTSLGAAIAEVQANIDAVIARLTVAHGLRCVGTEGSWLNDIDYPFELRQAAQWRHDLLSAKDAAKRTLGSDLPPLEGDIDVTARLLEDELRRHVSLLDGVGLALSRLEEGHRVKRFGVEDAALNQEALRLLAELRRIDEQLAELDPGTQSEVADAMGQMWLDEIGPYRDDVLAPLRAALTRLDKARLKLRVDGALDAAERLGRFVAFAKHISNAVIRPADIDGYTAYYQRVAQAPAGDAGPRPPRRLSARERRRKARLERARAPLQARYEEVSIRARERRAAEKVLARVGEAGTCALVMGAAHKDGLKQALLEVAKGRVGVVVVAPYDFSDVEGARE